MDATPPGSIAKGQSLVSYIYSFHWDYHQARHDFSETNEVTYSEIANTLQMPWSLKT